MYVCTHRCESSTSLHSSLTANTPCNGEMNPSPIQELLHSQMTDNKACMLNHPGLDLLSNCWLCFVFIFQFHPKAFKSKQAAKLSCLLFKCIKPVGDPSFSLIGDLGNVAVLFQRLICCMYVLYTDLYFSSNTYHNFTLGHDSVGFNGV